jgi:uncharacterized protein with von Willebrand factor type A (vWA) domain
MAEFEYSRYDGTQRFVPLDAEVLFDQISDILVEHGEYLLRQIERDVPDLQEVMQRLIRAGYLERDAERGLAVSPRGLRRLQDRAFVELFQIQARGNVGRHDSSFRGDGSIRYEETRPFVYGDPTSHLSLQETLRNAVARQGGGWPIQVAEKDLVVHEADYHTTCSTVLLLDMSGSMARYGKFSQAKRVALGLHSLIRTRFPGDRLRTVGFYSFASPLTERELLRVGPKAVTIFDHRVFLRIPIDRPPPFVPEHFTNIQLGLQYARRLLARDAARNKQIICVTDGEPTAHVEGRELVLAYPPTDRTAQRTLEEVRRCRDAGIRLSTIALIEDAFYLDLKNFVDLMARESRGVAAYCYAGDLGRCVLESFIQGRRERRLIS